MWKCGNVKASAKKKMQCSSLNCNINGVRTVGKHMNSLIWNCALNKWVCIRICIRMICTNGVWSSLRTLHNLCSTVGFGITVVILTIVFEFAFILYLYDWFALHWLWWNTKCIELNVTRHNNTPLFLFLLLLLFFFFILYINVYICKCGWYFHEGA